MQSSDSSHTSPALAAEVIDRYLAGESSADERVAVERLAHGPAMRAVLDIARSSDWIALRSRGVSVVEHAWQALQPRLVHPSASVVRPRAESGSRSRLARLGAGAALGVVALCLAAVAVWQQPWKTMAPASVATTALVEHRTAVGERARIRLADGSTVTLNVGSRLRYAKSFGATTRDVYLEGEALFAVANQAEVPFVVHTGDVATRVLGTSFTVRKYPTDADVRVVVAEGKVALGRTVLVTGDEGRATGHDRGAAVRVQHRMDIAAALAWTHDELAFTRTTLRDVIPELRRWYGLEISATDPALLDAPITTVFTTETPTQIVNVLTRILDARASRDGMRVVLSPR